jgi:hypothetical protein
MFSLLNGRVTVFTGFGKGSGKTTIFGAAVNGAQKAGAVGIFTIGFDGVGDKSPIIQVNPKDVLITTVPLTRVADASLDIIEALPGRSAIGRLCLARVVRGGTAALVGPEHFSQLASAIDLVRQKNLVNSILIDGAVGRITHVGALPDSQFLYCARADAANFKRVAENIELISALSSLPTDDDGHREDSADIKLYIEGPLTVPILEAIPEKIKQITIESLSDCFLDAASFKRASRRLSISVRRHRPLLGFVVALRNVKRETFLDAVPSASSKIIFNPFELEAA